MSECSEPMRGNQAVDYVEDLKPTFKKGVLSLDGCLLFRFMWFQMQYLQKIFRTALLHYIYERKLQRCYKLRTVLQAVPEQYVWKVTVEEPWWKTNMWSTPNLHVYFQCRLNHLDASKISCGFCGACCVHIEDVRGCGDVHPDALCRWAAPIQKLEVFGISLLGNNNDLVIRSWTLVNISYCNIC